MIGAMGKGSARVDKIERLKELRCYWIDDRAFYRLRDVCDALDVPRNTSTRHTASSWIGGEHKRYVWEMKKTRSGKVYGDKRFCYIDRAGVERLLLRYGGRVPRSTLLEALPASPAQW